MKRLLLLVVLFGLALPAPQGSAQTFPTKLVRLVIPYPPGGPVDDVGRLVGERLSELWQQPVVVENRSGADGGVGTEFVARSPADGYTLLLGNSGPITLNPLIKRLSYDPQKDLEPITLLVTTPQVLIANLNLPASSIGDLVALAKSRPPGTLNYASSGVGNVQHLAMEAFQSAAGIRMNHVPYRGTAPAYIDLLGGRVDVMLSNTVGSLNHIEAGSVRALGITSRHRLPQLPDVPTFAESYPDFEVTSWMGLFAPKEVPQPIIRKIQADAIKVMTTSEIQQHFAAEGAEAVASTPDQLRDFIQREAKFYAPIIRSAGITTE